MRAANVVSGVEQDPADAPMDSEGGGAKEPEDKTKEPPRKMVIWVGGAGDGPGRSNQTVYDIYENYTGILGEGNILFFTHRQHKELEETLKANADAEITLVGHSWGAATAARVVARGDHVEELITVDGVSRRRPDYGAVAENSGNWINYDSIKFEDRSDFISWLGGRWDDAPKGFANEHIRARSSHVQICIDHCVPSWLEKMRPK